MRDLFYFLGSAALILATLIYGAFILKPITLGLLIAIIIHPAVVYLKKYLKFHSLSFLAILMGIFILFFSVFSAISYQLFGLFNTLKSDKFNFENLQDSFKSLLGSIGLSSGQMNDSLSQGFSQVMSAGTDLMTMIISSSTSILFTILLGIFLSYFFSAYYHPLKEAVLEFFEDGTKEKFKQIFRESPAVIRRYLKGMSVVMLILAIMNTLVYWIIGLEYALIWGVLSGVLAFIPYLGSAMALLLPLTYSIISTSGFSQPLAILFSFLIIQQIEGNLLTPKIVGDAVDVNPLAAILFMVVSAQIWGIYGVFISIMLAGLLTLAFKQWQKYEPVAKILGEEIVN